MDLKKFPCAVINTFFPLVIEAQSEQIHVRRKLKTRFTNNENRL